MKTKKYYVKVVTADYNKCDGRHTWPIVVNGLGQPRFSGDVNYSNGVLEPMYRFAHIEIHDEKNLLIATTYGAVGISDAFIRKYVEKKGEIKEVLIEMEVDCDGNNNKCLIEEKFGDQPFYVQAHYCKNHMKNNETCHGCTMAKGELIPKLSSKGNVIIHPVKTKMKIEEIPIIYIKDILSLANPDLYATKIVKQWLEENNL
jgi:hypothetical protein